MKKLKFKKDIFFYSIIILIVYIGLIKVLNACDLVFLAWIRKSMCITISFLAVAGLIQKYLNIKGKRVLKLLFLIFIAFSSLILVLFNLFYIIEIVPVEDLYKYEIKNKFMIRELEISIYNEVTYYYYDFNPFVRSAKYRIKSRSFDIQDKRANMIDYFNKDGKRVADEEGNEFVNLDFLDEYKYKEKYYKKDVEEIINRIEKNCIDNIYVIENTGNTLDIYFSSNNEKLNQKELSSEKIKEVLELYIDNEQVKRDSIYKCEISDDNVYIENEKYKKASNYKKIEPQIEEFTYEKFNEKVFDKEDVPYYVENGKYYTIINNEKIRIIPLDVACDIADYYQIGLYYSRDESFNKIDAKLILTETEVLYWNINMKNVKRPDENSYYTVYAKMNLEE